MSIEQQEHLANLVKHPGWLLFKEHCRKQWGAEGYGRRMKAALSNCKAENLGVAVHGIDVANDEINALLSWPEDQVRKAEPKEAPVSLQRGGA